MQRVLLRLLQRCRKTSRQYVAYPLGGCIPISDRIGRLLESLDLQNGHVHLAQVSLNQRCILIMKKGEDDLFSEG